MKKKYKWGDKVHFNKDNGVVVSVRQIPNSSDDSSLDFMYEVLFKSDDWMDLSYEELEAGWIKENIPLLGIEMRKNDSYYCQKCDKVLRLNKTYSDDDRFVRCLYCHKKVNVQTND